jgi:hypothetical protein
LIVDSFSIFTDFLGVRDYCAGDTVGAQSIVHSHIGDNICQKNEKLFLQKIKRGNSAAILEQKKITYFASKVENSHVSKTLFVFLVKILPAIFLASANFRRL